MYQQSYNKYTNFSYSLHMYQERFIEIFLSLSPCNFKVSKIFQTLTEREIKAREALAS
jgi:hypothetical protein